MSDDARDDHVERGSVFDLHIRAIVAVVDIKRIGFLELLIEVFVHFGGLFECQNTLCHLHFQSLPTHRRRDVETDHAHMIIQFACESEQCMTLSLVFIGAINHPMMCAIVDLECVSHTLDEFSKVLVSLLFDEAKVTMFCSFLQLARERCFSRRRSSHAQEDSSRPRTYVSNEFDRRRCTRSHCIMYRFESLKKNNSNKIKLKKKQKTVEKNEFR